MVGTTKLGKDYVYAFGGFVYADGKKPAYASLDIVDVYDVSQDRWTTLSIRLPFKRSSNAVGFISDRAFLIGGWNATPRWEDDIGGVWRTSIDVFDTASESAYSLAYTTGDSQLCQVPSRAFASVTVADQILVIGGLGPNGEYDLLKSACAFKPAITDTPMRRNQVVTGSWKALPNLPNGIFAASAGAIGRTVYVFGGLYDNGDGGYSDQILKFDLGTSTAWEPVTGKKLAVPRGFIQVVPLSPNVLGLFGGHAGHIMQSDDTPVNVVESFSP